MNNYQDYNSTHQVRFFESLSAWRSTLRQLHPKARIEVAAGVRRAYIGPVKVAAFGSLPGFGYITGTFMGQLMHGRNVQRTKYLLPA